MAPTEEFRILMKALFTEVRGIGILRTSPFGVSRQFTCKILEKPRNAPALPLLIFFAGEAVQRR
jgi:hypothetical protein